MNLYQSVALGVAVAAVVSDLATRRIPNLLTFGAALVAVAAHGYAAGWTGAGLSLAGWLLGVAFFFPVFALGGMGAGDVKLLGASGRLARPSGGRVGGALFRRRRRRDGGVRGAVFGISDQGAHEHLGPLDVLASRRRAARARADALEPAGPTPGVCSPRAGWIGGDVMVPVNSLRQRLRSERGAELIEFALVFPVLLLVVLGIVDFGFLFQRMEVVTNAAREGARMAVLPGYSTVGRRERACATTCAPVACRRRPAARPATPSSRSTWRFRSPMPSGAPMTAQAGPGRVYAPVSVHRADCQLVRWRVHQRAHQRRRHHARRGSGRGAMSAAPVFVRDEEQQLTPRNMKRRQIL